jgi:hypothetical protein
MEARFPRHFTRQEANDLLVSLRPLVADMVRARDHLMALRPGLQPLSERARGNGGGRQASDLLEALDQLRRAIEAVSSLGVVVKDVNTGLVDFPARREGREVFLCWKYGEDQVGYWHEADSGFAGRQPI